MLTNQKIHEMMEIPIEKYPPGRFLRLMSWDNPVKNLYIFFPNEDINTEGTSRIEYCIQIFYQDTLYLLQAQSIDRQKLHAIKPTVILPTKQNVISAIQEISMFYHFLQNISKRNLSISEIVEQAKNLSLDNFILITNYCNITDFSKNINNSHMVRRFANFQKHTNHLFHDPSYMEIYLKEVENQLAYLNGLKAIYEQYELGIEDFITFVLLFDLRKNKNML